MCDSNYFQIRDVALVIFFGKALMPLASSREVYKTLSFGADDGDICMSALKTF